jgi:hypothetical protein
VKRSGWISLVVLTTFASWAQAASLIGDSVTAQLTVLQGDLSLFTQFTSPAIVGDDVEFKGAVGSPNDLPNVWVDVGATTITISFPGACGIVSGSPDSGCGFEHGRWFTITVGDIDLDPVRPFLSVSYAGPPRDVQVTQNSVSVSYSAVTFGEVDTFYLQALPEPATGVLGLMAAVGVVVAQLLVRRVRAN